MKSRFTFNIFCIQVVGSLLATWVWFVRMKAGGNLSANANALHSLVSTKYEMDQSNNQVQPTRIKRFQKIDNADSPYEITWPGHHLPSWARKSVNYDVPPDKQICLVHVGKAGGSAVGCSLGFSLHCRGTSQVKGVLPKVTSHVFHKNVYNCQEDSAHFLFVVRDPIDRARSAFNYKRPDRGSRDKLRGKFYVGCPFFHIEDYVQNGLTEHGEASKKCKRMARDAVKGTLPYDRGPSHFYYNYQFYYEAVPEDAPILVIRSEHIEEDWNNLEAFSKGKQGRLNYPQVSFPRNNVNTRSSEDDLYLSEESTLTLCQALCNEIQYYKKILGRAQNIDEKRLQVSLAELKAKCPIEATNEECPESLPDISAKLAVNVASSMQRMEDKSEMQLARLEKVVNAISQRHFNQSIVTPGFG